jgi:hypothetical protein
MRQSRRGHIPRHQPPSIRQQSSCFGALYGLATLIPLPAVAETLAADSRVSQTPIVDKALPRCARSATACTRRYRIPPRAARHCAMAALLSAKTALN